MPSVLDWTRFDSGGIGPERAFEAFSAQLFERWLRREYPGQATSYTLHGAGGDGGVEAFARLADATIIGFQAKWFRKNLGDSEIRQIRNSLNRAVETFPGLTRYVVAVPLNLTKGRREGERGGLERWEAFVEEVARRRPLELIRWDEARLSEQLASPGNQELKATWFQGELTLEALQRAWNRVRRCLDQRYLPTLHGVGRIEAILASDLWTAGWISGAVQRLTRSSEALRTARLELGYFAQLTEGRRSKSVDAALATAMNDVEAHCAHTEALAAALRTGPSVSLPPLPTGRGFDSLDALVETIKREDDIHIGTMLKETLALLAEMRGELDRVDGELRGSLSPRVLAGPAGCGKTHATAASVESALGRGEPALMLLGREQDPGAGIARALGDALDTPGWSLRRILDGLEALAVLAQLQSGSDDPARFVRTLLVVDGIEESVRSTRWVDFLAGLSAELLPYPRIHLVLTTRPEFATRLGLPSDQDVTELPEDGDVDLPALLQDYARRFALALEQVPWLGWVLRSPLEVRLLAEEFAGSSVTSAVGANANLLTLFRRKLARLEHEARERAGARAWSEGLGLVHEVLMALAEATMDGRGRYVADHEIIRPVAGKDDEFTAERARSVLDLLQDHGLVDRWIRPSRGLQASRPTYALATRHLADYLLATRVSETLLKDLSDHRKVTYPEVLEGREMAAALFAAQLAEQGQFVLDLDWTEPPVALWELHARSLALLPPDQAGMRSAEIQQALLQSNTLNRALLRVLVLPVARIPRHPLGPMLLDAALRAVPLAEREPVWSVSEDLRGVGPWRGSYDTVLDEVHLDPAVDDWDGLPLVAAWSMSSVVEARRTRAREMLALWGAARLDQMVRLVRHMADVDDPQIVDDMAVAALGAAIGAPVPHPSLRELAILMDALYFAENASAWSPSVQVRVAARGVIERADMIFPGEFTELVRRAAPPYAPRGGDWPALDLDPAVFTTPPPAAVRPGPSA